MIDNANVRNPMKKEIDLMVEVKRIPEHADPTITVVEAYGPGKLHHAARRTNDQKKVVNSAAASASENDS